MSTGEPLLSVRSLTAGYDGVPVVRSVSLEVGAGEVVALLGANGAGKTTTLRAVSGTVRPLGGTINFLSESTAGVAPERLTRRGLAHVPEGRGIFFGLTVAEHYRLHRVRAEACEELFGALAPLRDRRAGLLSGGEQQMLAMSCAMARRPRMMLVDELSLGLAPVIVESLLPTVRRYAQENGAGVLLVEQHVQLALQVVDRAYVLAHGQIVLHRPAADLRGDMNLLRESYLGSATGEPEPYTATKTESD
jgi:branched-chain amino acid transport system ATP-binding protein